jgi:hypothetical protein
MKQFARTFLDRPSYIEDYINNFLKSDPTGRIISVTKLYENVLTQEVTVLIVFEVDNG